MKHSKHPNPLIERENWRDLCGTWRFAYDDAGRWKTPEDVRFDREILVPYPPESKKSGIHDENFHPVVWYGLSVPISAEDQQDRLLLKFGAVDYAAKVWVNGQLLASHEGGHTPFCADVTEAARGSDTLEIVVRAEDDPHDLAKPRGKQDWLPEAHSIWYPRTTGIWQPVWLERVPEIRIEELQWTSHMERWEIGMDVRLLGTVPENLSLRVRLAHGDDVIADDLYRVRWNEVSRRIALADPGIDDFRNELLWSPNHPTLMDATVELLQGDTVIDRVRSYTALRSVDVQGNRFLLNGRPYYLKMVLDQGYWPDSLMAATDEELRRDVELTRQLGFNAARKHQKIENPRWLYWCDVLGLLVWEEMPSPYRFNNTAVERLTREWTEAIKRDASHPCIVAWVPLNESWGVPDLPTNAAHRDYVRALYHLTKTLDPSRPVIGNDGWEHVATDLITVHDYTDDPDVLRLRYGTLESTRRSIEQQRPGDRVITVAGFQVAEQPVILSEFGGIAFVPGGNPGKGFGVSEYEAESGWGYSVSDDEADFLNDYTGLLEATHECFGLSGFCYTQLTDTFQEKNGLLYEDRSPKTDMRALAHATQGSRTPREMTIDPAMNPFGYGMRWRKRLTAPTASDD
ncbi:glycoside hydrolase family 2 TIM barrel-domain containing protein [Deinococcus peraridilitoris]|uniref:Beta-galactosidase/beta-glucuronidase n=1 Tax=Deinococcus peraridilitoris (strain DSM 19664 / LMG 22246 / CIP 109416 / KR-200) TaxID=937777 RepID=K9ZZ44_DEIPD|nr:glycoside hydrolase family 2 TIM barrel-domain containing protein [Deinococcus peraridilitoris]AFZ66474.1 beta-galactosidase/beta-glucuronidase [Deinococcus peraridilitoris DSM 19664]